MSRTDAVSGYVERGWVPFAYVAETLPPMRWQESAITEGTVRECEAATAEGLPIGIVLGKPSGIVVVDIDVQHNGSLEAVMDLYGKEEVTTYVVTTPSGGYHLYYEYPEGVDNLPKRVNAGKWIDKLGPGIDLLADGHHVQAPPTVRVNHPTKLPGAYKIAGDHPVAPLPAALLADWLESVDIKQEYRGEAVEQIPESDYGWVLDLHRANVRAAAEAVVGERDDVVYRRLSSSVRIALYLPDEVLSVARVELDFVTEYEAAQGESILDIDGKLRRAIKHAEENPWVVVSADEATLPDGVSPEQAGEFVDRVAKRKLDKLVNREVDKQLSELDAGEVELPPMLSGAALLKAASAVPEWAVEGLLAPGHSVVIAAQKKSGKTTLVLNLIHALTTGEPFLGGYTPVKPMRVAYFDMELGLGTASGYAEQLGIPLDMLEYIPLKGFAKKLDCRNDGIRAKWVRRLLERNVSAVVIDPVGPIVSALGLGENNNSEVRSVLDSFDTLTREAGCLLGPIVAHHSGHDANGRARGASAFGDWPAVEWNLLRPTDSNGAPVPDAARSFSIQSNRATGGVLHGPRQLDYQAGTRRVWYGESIKPRDPKRDRYDEFVGGSVGDITVRTVISAVPGLTDKTAKTWLDADVGTGLLSVTAEGSRGRSRPRTWVRRDPFSSAV